MFWRQMWNMKYIIISVCMLKPVGNFGRRWKEERYANVPHLIDSLYNPYIEKKTYCGPCETSKTLAKIETQVQVTVMSIYNCIQKIIMYKLAANFCSPVLPHWVEVCATSQSSSSLDSSKRVCIPKYTNNPVLQYGKLL